ncbi:acetyl-CoA carboxylase biotin carboxylase subunit [Mycoplasmatota bacterium WC44]
MKKILIANRGEIAVRIIRACKELGIESVAIYSTADKDSLHVKLADEAICVGGVRSKDSYLKMDNIISAAINSGADAIHPGFGFLSENPTFVSLVEDCGLKFIGPSSEVIENMGNKAKARELMMEAEVKVVPGSEGTVDLESGIELAEKIGYPVLIKASAGGGGRGMRVAQNSEEFVDAFKNAKLEAKNAFGDDSMYVEKYIINPKHIEFQILADKFGNVIHLGERDCSVQRRNQKMIEEAPSSSLSNEMRKEMGIAAVNAAKSVGYVNAGTIEFIVTDEDYYFIEMNTRIQVEHPVTEMITGVDLIKEQINIASGKKLEYTQEDIDFNGHAIEVRINAENPKEGFRPSPGEIKFLHVPSGFGVRFDSQVYHGYKIPAFYDSMVGKLIVHGKTRKEAIQKMRRSLEELIIDGIDNNIKLQYLILHNPEFVKGNFDTGFIEKHISKLLEYR